MKSPVVWAGPPPVKCDTCQTKILNVFYDAATRLGRWAFMCPSCHMLGPGRGEVGPGKGQKYVKQNDGSFLKTEG